MPMQMRAESENILRKHFSYCVCLMFQYGRASGGGRRARREKEQRMRDTVSGGREQRGSRCLSGFQLMSD